MLLFLACDIMSYIVTFGQCKVSLLHRIRVIFKNSFLKCMYCKNNCRIYKNNTNEFNLQFVVKGVIVKYCLSGSQKVCSLCVCECECVHFCLSMNASVSVCIGLSQSVFICPSLCLFDVTCFPTPHSLSLGLCVLLNALPRLSSLKFWLKFRDALHISVNRQIVKREKQG